jgi:cell division protease FtsH
MQVNKKPQQKKPFGMKNLLIWFVVIATMFAVSTIIDENLKRKKEIPFSEFLERIEAGEVDAVQIKGKEIYGQFKDEKYFFVYLAEYPNLAEKLHENNVIIKAKPLVSQSEKVFGGLIGWLPFIILIGLWFFFMRGMGAGGKDGGGSPFSFGKSKAKLMQQIRGKVTFKDVAGIDEAREELAEIVDFLKSPLKYTKIGAKIPRGCLLIGAPGTGKTLLARAIAGEASVPFFSISGSEFVEMFVGVGASRVRDMFAQGKANAPCIIFIDEIDAVGRHRGSGVGGGNDEREQTLNQLLVEMDGFEVNQGVIVIAATNRPDVLDTALMRPGRFDRQIMVPTPDINGREAILAVHAKKVNTAPDVDLHTIARGTPGFSGADLANVINEGALISARKDQKVITMREIEAAKDKIMMGLERKSMVMDEDEKRNTAYHEGGHAIVAMHCKFSDPIHKATIIPRGRSLGLVMRLPEKDRVSVSRAKLLDDIAVAMGGRAAEELVMGYAKVTTGASMDIKGATSMAKNMVIKWGLSDKVGPVFHGQDESSPSQRFEPASEETMKLIDSEVKAIIQDGEKRAHKILKDNKKQLDLIANALLEYETLTGSEIKDVIANKKIEKRKPSSAKVKKVSKGIVPTFQDEDVKDEFEEKKEKKVEEKTSEKKKPIKKVVKKKVVAKKKVEKK